MIEIRIASQLADRFGRNLDTRFKGLFRVSSVSFAYLQANLSMSREGLYFPYFIKPGKQIQYYLRLDHKSMKSGSAMQRGPS